MLRTSIVHAAAPGRELAVVLQYGRLYVWHDYDVLGDRVGLNTQDFLVTGSRTEGLVTQPRPTAGIPVDGTAESLQRIRSRLSRFSNRTFYICVVVRKDSFDVFRHLRQALSDGGYKVHIMPADQDTSIVDHGGDNHRVQ